MLGIDFLVELEVVLDFEKQNCKNGITLSGKHSRVPPTIWHGLGSHDIEPIQQELMETAKPCHNQVG